ncbi:MULTISPECIES: LysR substrate-binding domain-containing protein [unclassified Caballeronia]|jgi:LysR family glycine cleavage system transcriptional activator|uniref:LysR substrate-binding domain-containing protein n=1 Tax=unclassified Caballeronia TaxID=2646786 RepID=UPI003ECD19B4
MPRPSPHIPPIPPLAALKAFEAVARLGSLSRAAEELNVTKSAISHQLRALESALGTTLMHRGGTTSRAQPTSAGQELLAAIEASLIPLGEACERLTMRRRKRRRTLTVSANAPFSSLWLAPHVVEFSTRYPEIAVNLRVFDDEPDWQNDTIDIAILRVPLTSSSGDEPDPHPGDRALVRETVFPVCSPLLMDPRTATAQTLTEHRLLQEEHHASSREIDWQTWFALLGAGALPEQNLVRLSSFSPIIGAAIAGKGVALGRSPLIDFDLAHGRLVRLFPEHELPGSWQFVIRLHPHRSSDPTLIQFQNFMLERSAI